MTPPRQFAAALAVALTILAAPAPAAAQSKSDAFAGKIPPVSGQLFRKAGRLELTLGGGLSLNDAFFTKQFGSAKLGWHFTEAWSASLQVAGGRTAVTGSSVICPRNGGCREADEAALFQVPGRVKGIAGAELAWSPVYGKLNFLSLAIGHFDFSVLMGGDLIAYDEVLCSSDVLGATACPAASDALSGATPGTVTTIGGHVGLGTRIFFAEWVALRLEVKDYLFSVKVPNMGPGGDLQNQLFTELGVSFFLPTRNRRSQQP